MWTALPQYGNNVRDKKKAVHALNIKPFCVAVYVAN